MIIDEINMINVKLLIKIDNNCTIIKSHERDIINFFDNISIVIFMNDFFQFVLMNEKSL
jgi:signal recognition particle receptor subunit beta